MGPSASQIKKVLGISRKSARAYPTGQAPTFDPPNREPQ